MAQINTGGPAFPTGDMVERDEKGALHGYPISSAGMSRRDYFAAKAMQAAISGHIAHYGHENHWPEDTIADYAARVSDALIAALDEAAE